MKQVGDCRAEAEQTTPIPSIPARQNTRHKPEIWVKVVISQSQSLQHILKNKFTIIENLLGNEKFNTLHFNSNTMLVIFLIFQEYILFDN